MWQFVSRLEDSGQDLIMGLSIGVGLVAEYAGSEYDDLAHQIRGDLEQINQTTAKLGLPLHEEPESFDKPLHMRVSLRSFPYSWLHYLRRFAAHVMRDPKWVPYPIQPGEDPAEDPVLRQMYKRMESHLLCHSDSEGYYLPVDVDQLIIDEDDPLPGMVVGSSLRLKEELLTLVGALEIDVDDRGWLSDAEADELSKQRPTSAPFAIERLVWLALYEACRISIDYQTAIVFE